MKTTYLFTIIMLIVISFKSYCQTDNTFFGDNSGINNTGNSSSGFGKNALQNNTGNSNIAFGLGTLKSSSGGFNCAFGNEALSFNRVGNLNVAIGTRALLNNDSGSRNIAIGHRTLERNSSGSNNTAVGYASFLTNNGNNNVSFGSYTPRNLLTGDSNIFIGTESAINLVNGSNNVVLGNRVTFLRTPSTAFMAGNDTNKSIIIADGTGAQRIFIEKNGNTGIGLGNNIIPANRLDIKGGVVIGRNYTPNGITQGQIAPTSGLLVEGRVGIGTVSPNNKVEITQGTDGNSGLRFTNLTSNFNGVTVQPGNKFLSVNATGDVVLQKVSNSIETNNLISSANIMTSNVSGIISSASIVNSISNTINTNNQLITSVNGVQSVPVNLPAQLLQTISQSGNTISLSNNGGSFTIPSTSVVAGNNIMVTGDGSPTTPFLISSNDKSIYDDNGTIDQSTTINNNRIITMNNSNIWFNSFSSESNGKIYIGSIASYPNVTGNYKLFVEGGILTEKVKVALRSTDNWADYVFEKNYDLMPLKNVEEYINKNKHLPGIDSAEELSEKGLDLAEMQAKHMAKIEELTLYIIAQNKAIEKNSKDILELKKQIQALTSNEH